jgi:hypothetical protein
MLYKKEVRGKHEKYLFAALNGIESFLARVL